MYDCCQYENLRRVCYGTEDSPAGVAVFIPVCPNCGRFVKADKSIMVNEDRGVVSKTNADCKKCGRVLMPFEGFF